MNLVTCTFSKDRQQVLLGPHSRRIKSTEAFEFLRGDLYWGHNLARAGQTSLVMEEIGRNTGNVWSSTYSGSPEEMRPLLKFTYFHLALRAACFCAMAPDGRIQAIEETAKELALFPREAHLPLPVTCACVATEEFGELAKHLAANISLSPNRYLVKLSPDPKWPWNLYDHRIEVALMLALGVSNEGDIEAGLHYARARGDGCTYKDGEPSIYDLEKGAFKDLLSAVQMQRDGTCTFREALALAS